MKLFKLGLVTVLFNSDNVLEGFFQSLSVQNFKDYHLFIIDNTANIITNELISTLVAKYPISSFTHIKNATNGGVAAGNNQGIELSISSGSTHTLILNNDILFNQKDVLRTMYDDAVVRNETLIIPKILFYDTNKIWMAGGKFSYFRGSTRHVGEGCVNGVKFDKNQYFNYAPTCFILVDNKVFHDVGIMDESYFVYYDDSDFIFRAIKAGNKIYYDSSVTIQHKVSSSTGGTESLFTLYYSNRNRIRFIKKNFTGITYCVAISYTLITRVIKLLMYNKSQRKELIKAIQDGWAL